MEIIEKHGMAKLQLFSAGDCVTNQSPAPVIGFMFL